MAVYPTEKILGNLHRLAKEIADLSIDISAVPQISSLVESLSLAVSELSTDVSRKAYTDSISANVSFYADGELVSEYNPLCSSVSVDLGTGSGGAVEELSARVSAIEGVLPGKADTDSISGSVTFKADGIVVGTYNPLSGNLSVDLGSGSASEISAIIERLTNVETEVSGKQDQLDDTNAGPGIFITSGQQSHNLPEGYTELEYVTSTGAEKVNTGLKDSDIDGFRVTFKSSYAQYAAIFGNYVNESTNCTRVIFQSSNNNYFYTNLGTKAGGGSVSVGPGLANDFNTIYTASPTASTRSITLNALPAVTTSIITGTTNTHTIYLFASSGTAAGHPSSLKTVEFFKNGELFRQFVPAMRNSDGKTGFYEKTTDVFFAPTGGDLTPGSIISDSTLISIDNTYFATVARTGSYDDLHNKPTLNYTHRQEFATNVWTITHNMGKYPVVSCFTESSGAPVSIIGDIQYISENKLTVTFSAEVGGFAVLS